jgi:hypothetical protein
MSKITSKTNKNIFLTVAFATLLCAGKISLGLPNTSMEEFGGIWAAIEKGYFSEVEKIVRGKNFNINQTVEFYGRVTPLMLACYDFGNLNFNIIKFLLENGADKSVNIDDGNSGFPLLMPIYGCYRGNAFDVVKLLLEYGAKVDKKSKRAAKEKKGKRVLELFNAVEKFDKAQNKKNFIDKYAKDGEIYDLLTKRWLNSKKNEPLKIKRTNFSHEMKFNTIPDLKDERKIISCEINKLLYTEPKPKDFISKFHDLRKELDKIDAKLIK